LAAPTSLASTDGTLRAALPNARISILQGQGHVATMTAPDLVADEVARFLNE